MNRILVLTILLQIVLLNIQCNSEKKESKNKVIVENPVICERIDGPANLRDSINGKIILSIEDNIQVECSEIKNGWFYIGVGIPLNKEQYEKYSIKKGEKIFNGETLICTALEDISLLMTSKNDDEDKEIYYFGIIDGYTHKDNIKQNSIVERELEKILNSGKKLSKELFQEHLQNFSYENHGLTVEKYENLEQYMVYGSWIDDPSPIDRVRLMFDNNELIAVIHERELSMNGKKSYKLDRGLEILIIKEFEENELEEFVEKNKKSYWGVD